MNRVTSPLLLAFFTGWLALPGPARADVTDKGDFFSKDAVEKANRRIAEAKEKHKKDLVIETYSEVPKDLQADFKKEKAQDLFDNWARGRAKHLEVNGVYIFLCRDKERDVTSLQIEVGADTRKRAFTMTERDKLFSEMRTLLKEKTREKNDEALDLAVRRVTNAYIDHDKAQAREGGNKGGGERGNKGGGIPGWLCIGVCVLLGVWLVVGLMRGMSGGGGGGMGGGGGFFSSMLGGMFGAAAGMWMYDHFFGGGHSAWGGDGGMGGGGDSPGYGSDTGGDYSGGGGDFDGGGGGGGGGGGDFGGGGGDFGGGGGDF